MWALFFCKQKTAYEMRISDWSSDVCSSDLIVVFPHMIVPLFVGRDKSVRALEDVMKDDKQILLVTQKNAADDDPAADETFDVGTSGTVLQLLKDRKSVV